MYTQQKTTRIAPTLHIFSPTALPICSLTFGLKAKLVDLFKREGVKNPFPLK